MEIPPELMKDAVNLGQNLPDVFLGEFTSIDGRWESCKMPDGRTGIRLIFWFPILPFLKFSIPFHTVSLDSFLSAGRKALDDLNDEETTAKD